MDKLDPRKLVTPFSLEWRHTRMPARKVLVISLGFAFKHRIENVKRHSNSWIITRLHVHTDTSPLFFFPLHPSNCVANVTSVHINMIAKTGPSSLCVLIFKTKAFLFVLQTLCSSHHLSTAPPLSVAADHNRHLNIFCIALITYLFFTSWNWWFLRTIYCRWHSKHW